MKKTQLGEFLSIGPLIPYDGRVADLHHASYLVITDLWPVRIELQGVVSIVFDWSLLEAGKAMVPTWTTFATVNSIQGDGNVTTTASNCNRDDDEGSNGRAWRRGINISVNRSYNTTIVDSKNI